MNVEDEPLLVNYLNSNPPTPPPDQDTIEVESSHGSSTMQTSFNIANVIIGVSLLALPMALRYTGWIIGLFLFISFALVTNTTAKLLTKCQDFYLHTTGIPLLTYGDIGEAAFGPRGRYFIQCIFTCELFGASVALFLLITKSLYALTSDYFTEIELMLIIWSVMTITTWPKSLSILSYGSMVGILCIANLLVVIYFDGFYNKKKPGSLLDPANTALFPTNWLQVPLSFGLIMAGYAGHACFPGFYASMKRPQQFGKAVNIAYGTGLAVYLLIAVAGYLMFGEAISPMITENLNSDDYPRFLYYLTMTLIIINPATKYPLTLYPIVLDLEAIIFGIGSLRKISTIEDVRKDPISHQPTPVPSETASPTISIASESTPLIPSVRNLSIAFYKHQAFKRIFFRTFVSALVLLTAILIPQFERVVQLLGSLFSITSSILFPIMCYLAFFKSNPPKYMALPEDVRASTTSAWNDPLWLLQTDPSKWVFIPTWQRVLSIVIFVFFAFVGISGTIWAVLPASMVPR